MPWRLLIAIAIFTVFLAFITFNLDNRCDISFGFYVFENKPVFLTVFLSFALGLFCAFPLHLSIKKPKKEKPARESKPLGIKSKFFKRNGKNPDSGSYEKI
jgi:hypothetical protein